MSEPVIECVGLEKRFQEGELEVTVRMAPDSTFYLDSGSGRLFFSSKEGTFYFTRMEGDDPCLRAFFLALPRLPLAHRQGLSWEDHLPAGVVTWGARRALVRLARSVHPRVGTVAVRLTFEDSNTITGKVESGLLRAGWETRVKLHPFRGFESIQVGDMRMERVEEHHG